MDQATKQTLTVPDDAAAMRLQDYLERAWPQVERRQLRSLIRAGSVQLNFGRAEPQSRVSPGDVISVEIPPEGLQQHRAMPDRDRQFPVLAESDFCLIVAKPAGVPSVPDRGGKDLGVYGELASLRPDDDLRIAHRLDRETSGCLVIARGLVAARWLDRCFRERLVHKQYLAVVEGRVARDEIVIRRALGPDRRRPGFVTVVADGSKRSREAETHVEVVERFRGHTLLRLRPLTGRGHQLRAHLRSIGHPIVADVDYGARGPLLLSEIKRGYKARPGVVETPLLRRQFLHSERIEVPPPEEAAGPSVAATAPLPDDLERALEKLRRFAALDRSKTCN